MWSKYKKGIVIWFYNIYTKTVQTSCGMSLVFRNNRFMLDEMFQRKADLFFLKLKSIDHYLGIRVQKKYNSKIKYYIVCFHIPKVW